MNAPNRAADLPAEPWAQAAACATYPTQLFVDEHLAKDAKTICHCCPVVQECLRWALVGEVDDDIWGGRTPKERRRLTLTFIAQPIPQPPAAESFAAPKEQRKKPPARTRISVDPPPTSVNPGRQQTAKCGTESGYRRHLRRGEDICDDCRQAIRQANDSRRRNTTRTPKNPAQCGTTSGYRRHRRRHEDACQACKDANSAAIQQYRSRV